MVLRTLSSRRDPSPRPRAPTADRPRRRAACVLAALLLIAVVPLAAQRAQAQEAGDIYTVAGLSVDVRAETSAQARQQALREAQRRAFFEVVSRLALETDIDPLRQVQTDAMTQLVRDISVTQERTSDVRYLAELSVGFAPEALQSFLRERDVPFAQARSGPVVVLPVWSTSEGTQVWGGPNPWAAAWRDQARPVGLVPMRLPNGSDGDREALSSAGALEADAEGYARLAQRYDAQAVVRVTARPVPRLRQDMRVVEIAVRAFGDWPVDEERFLTLERQIDTGDGSAEAALYRDAVEQVMTLIEDQWTRANIVRFSQRGRVRVVAPVSGLGDWVMLEQGIAALPIVESVEPVSLHAQRVVFRVHYFGARERLAETLRDQGYRLAQERFEWRVTGMPARATNP